MTDPASVRPLAIPAFAERLERRIQRDAAERGRDREAVVTWHEQRVQPMHDLFVEPSRAYADLLIPHGGHNQDAIEALAARVLELLGPTP